MSRAASAVAVLGAALAAFVTASAFTNGLASGSGTPVAFYAVGLGLVALGLAGAMLALRERPAAALTLLVPAAVGFIAWPYLVPGAMFLLAALGALASRGARESTVGAALLGAAVLLFAATGALALLGSFAYPLAGLIAICCAFGSAAVSLLRARAGARS